MYPYLYIGAFEIPVYALIIFIAFTVGLFICGRLAPLYGINSKYVVSSGSFIALGVLIGAKLVYMITKLPDFISHYTDTYSSYNSIETFRFLFGGYVFYGGLIGGIVGVLVFCKNFHFYTPSYVTVLVPLIPFAHSFGRIGCFLAGCCYGIPYDGIFSVRFPKNIHTSQIHIHDRFPVQLLEALLCFILFVIIYTYTKKKIPLGFQTLGIYLIFYSIMRFFLEYLRGDAIRGKLLLLSTSQWISLLLLPIGIMLIRKNRR